MAQSTQENHCPIKLHSLCAQSTMKVGNQVGRLEFDRNSGILRRWIHSGTGTDMCGQTRGSQRGLIGGIRVWDDLDKRWWDDFYDKGDIEIEEETSSSLVFVKSFSGCPFAVRHRVCLKSKSLSWTLEFTQDSETNRGLRAVYQLPLAAGWGYFSPCLSGHVDRNNDLGDCVFDGCTQFNFMYHMGPYFNSNEITVPFFALFDRRSDTGFAIASPAEANVPSLHYEFTNRNAFAWASHDPGHPSQYTHLDVTHSMIGMHGKAPCIVEMDLYFGQGGWRPLLGQYVDAHHDMFYPRCESVWERAGTFKCGGIAMGEDDKMLQQYKSLGGKYFELHGHFPYYGKYFSEGQWDGTAAYESSRGANVDNNTAASTGKINVDRLKSAIDTMQANDVSVHYYINFVDGDRDHFLVNHPDSIALGENGEPFSSGWRFCDTLHPFPGTSGYHSLKQDAIKALKTYNIDGFFYDCFRHFDIDFRHSDGVTMINNKPASCVLFSMANLAKELVKEGYLMEKDTFANKPRTIQSMGYVDGMLLEGDGRGPELFYNYTTLAKPNFYMWGDGVVDEEEQLKRALVLGAFPNCSVSNDHESAVALYKQYLPLFEYIRGRVFCFEPKPLSLSPGLEAEVYTVGQDYIVPVSNQNISVNDAPLSKKKELALTVNKADYISRVLIHYAGEKKPRECEILRDGQKLVVPMPLLRSAAMILLNVGTSRNNLQKPITAKKDYFDSCGDPVSAFEMGSGIAEQ